MARQGNGRTRRSRTTGEGDNRNARVQMFYQDLHELQPYARNPRDNAAAVESVANSIKSFGFLVPVVVDQNNVLVAGHTRVEAAKTLGLSEVPAIRAEHLTDAQINAFRLIDNKVSELARWDFDLLAGEIQSLNDSGIDFTNFGWTHAEIDCLSDMVSGDCLSTEGLTGSEEQERARNVERRAPSTARFVMGEIVFFLQVSDYRRWVDGLRALHDYSEDNIVADIKQRLGITEGAVEAAQRVRRRRSVDVAD